MIPAVQCAATHSTTAPAMPAVAPLPSRAAPRAAAAGAAGGANSERPAAAAGLLRAMQPRALALHRPWWERLRAGAFQALTQWREAARERAALRSLATLDERTLKDIGLAELAPRLAQPDWMNLERARW